MDGRRSEYASDSAPRAASVNPLLRRTSALAGAPAATPEVTEPLGQRENQEAQEGQAPGAEPVAGIGALEYVDPREAWPTGDAELRRWLADTPRPLSLATGLDLQPMGTVEQPYDDSLVLTTTSGDKVVVVVETGTSSDDALGRLMRAVAASDAKAVIWATAQPRNEHIATMSWLNRLVAERSYIVQLRAVRIDSSLPAPIFTPALRPPRREDMAPDAPRSPVSPEANRGRRADDWPSVALVERGTGHETTEGSADQGESVGS